MQKISPIKERILKFADTLDISRREFYKKTGISRGTLESSTGITEDTLAKFIATFGELSPEWILTGRGEMLRNNDTIQSISGNSNIQISGNENMAISHRDLEDKITYLEDKVLFLTEQIKAKDSQINTLLSIIQKNK